MRFNRKRPNPKLPPAPRATDQSFAGRHHGRGQPGRSRPISCSKSRAGSDPSERGIFEPRTSAWPGRAAAITARRRFRAARADAGTDGIALPDDVIQRGIEAYALHTECGQSRIQAGPARNAHCGALSGAGPASAGKRARQRRGLTGSSWAWSKRRARACTRRGCSASGWTAAGADRGGRDGTARLRPDRGAMG